MGMELYTTVGQDWWREGYWRFGEVWGDDRLAQQFLNTNPYREVEPGLFLTFDQCHPEHLLYGVSLEKAKQWEWDFILATVQENQKGFHRFARETGAKYLYQIGNARQFVDLSLDPIILAWPQEFDYQSTFRFREPIRMDRITSFVNLLPKIPESWEPLADLMMELPDFGFRSFGHECPDGFLTPVAAIAEEMARSGWAYQDKPTGDGFGHVLFNWAAVGRPLIGHGRYYERQRGGIFWQDGITCIDLDKHSIPAAAQIIAAMTPEGHRGMCRAIRRVLDETYNPARDADEVADFLGISSGRKDLTTAAGCASMMA